MYKKVNNNNNNNNSRKFNVIFLSAFFSFYPRVESM